MKQRLDGKKKSKSVGYKSLVFVTLLLIINAVFVWITGSRLDGQLADIRAAGDPVSKADLAAKPIPPDDNAATFLKKAREGCTAIDSEFSESSKDWYFYREYPMPAEVKNTLEGIIESHAEVFTQLEQAAACTSYNPGLNYTLSDEEFAKQIQENAISYRDYGRALWSLAELQIAQGKYDEAVETSLAQFRLARLFGDKPFVLDCLVANILDGMAVHYANIALQTGHVSKPVRDKLDAEVALHKPLENMLRALKIERAYVFDQRFVSGGPAFWFVVRPISNWRASHFLDTFRDYIHIMANPGSYDLDDKTLDQFSGEIGVIGVHKQTMESQAQIRTLRVLNALLSHEIAEDESTPGLDKLGLPAEATTDPFTGKPLQVKKTARGWLVYSVGPNLKDDGGALLGNHGINLYDYDIGVGPPPVEKP